MAATAHTPAEGSGAAEGTEQPAAPVETEPVAAPTGETLLVQPFPVDQGVKDGEVTAPAVTTPSMVEMPAAPGAVPVASEGAPQEQSEAVVETPAAPAPQTGSDADTRRVRHAAATAQTPAEPASEAVVEAAADAVPETASQVAAPTRTAPSSGTAESAYEPVAVPSVEHPGGEPVAAPTGETVAPDPAESALADAVEQQPTASSGEAWENVAVSARTPVDTGREGEQATREPSEEPGESGRSEQAEIPWYAASVEGAVPPASDATETASVTDTADAAEPEARAASAPTASTPEDDAEDRVDQSTPTEQVAEERGKSNEENAETPEAPVEGAEAADGAEAAQEEPAEPAPAPWGNEELRRRIYTEGQEFVAAIARRDVNELASRYGISGNDLAGLDEQLTGLSVPAADLALYPVEQADDYVDGHHRLDLSELEGGGVVITSELWAHDAATGARLLAHWNPMGIYPFDFRDVSM